MRVLVIESDLNTRQTVQTILAKAGMTAEIVARGDEGIDLATIYEYDIMLLDLNADGFNTIKSLRAKGRTLPVLAVSGLSDVATKVRALTTGADDCITKPYHADELTARIGAIVRRSQGHATSTIDIGDICIDFDTQTVSVGETRVNLSAREYQIMEAMALRMDTTLTKDMLLNHLYGGLDEPELKIIDVFICKIRKKLSAAGAHDPIETMWGRGYCLRSQAPTAIAA